MTSAIPADKPPVELIGYDGGAEVMLARCCRAARAAGWTEEQVYLFCAEALRDDFIHLLQTSMRYFEVD